MEISRPGLGRRKANGKLRYKMDTVTILGVALIGMLPNIGLIMTLWFGNKSSKFKGANK